MILLFQIIQKLIRLLPNGHQIKREVDFILDECFETMSPMHFHIREVIFVTYNKVSANSIVYSMWLYYADQDYKYILQYDISGYFSFNWSKRIYKLSKLLKQGYLVERLKSSFRKFYGRYGDLVEQYGVTLSRMLNDILTLDQQWLPYRSDFPPISWPLYRAWPSPNYEWFTWSICNGCG